MPADVNKTIEISMQADLKQFTSQLKRMPGISQSEYKKITKNLQTELRRAQAAAQKSAKVQAKAMKQAENAYQQTAKAAKNVRTQSREMGAAFGSLEDVVSEISPELGGLAMTIGTVGQAFRALSRSLATGNPYVLALVAAVAALTAGYHLLTAGAREAERQQKLLEEGTKKLTERLAAQAEIVTEITKSQAQASRELAVFTGTMTQLDADIANLRDEATDQLTKQLQTQNKFIAEQKELLRIAEKAKNSYSDLTEEEEKQLETAMLLSKNRAYNNGLASTHAGISVQMGGFQKELNDKLHRELVIRSRIEEENNKTFEMQKQLLLLQDELRKEQEEEEKRQERIAKARAAARERDAKLSQMLNHITQQRTTLEETVFNLQNNQKDRSQAIIKDYAAQVIELDKQRKILEKQVGREHELRSIEEARAKLFQERDIELARAMNEQIAILDRKHERELDSINSQREKIYAQYEEAEAVARTARDKEKLAQIEKESINAIAELDAQERELETQHLEKIGEMRKGQNEQRLKFENELATHRKKLHEQEIKQITAGVQASIAGLQTFATAGLQLLENTGNENKDVINVLFRLNQAAALADIAMKTAVALAAAPGQYGPAAPIAMAAITAGAALQTGVVLSQKPPMHMGGYIAPAPDENTRTVLGGEYVLDRQTVRTLGAENLNKLQNNASLSPEVIVMSPFKHMDRYNKSAMRRAKRRNNKPARGRY